MTDTPAPPGDLDAALEPFAMFAQWFAAAKAHEPNDPDAMALATCDADGLPDVRMVLCRGMGPDGLVFYTNDQSAKGRQLQANPQAAGLFHWKSLRRQARFRGAITTVEESLSDAYFHGRPKLSQIGAWASEQSRPLDSRGVLEARVDELTRQYGETEPPRPAHWHGFRLNPVEVELWADGAFRLHDRVRFTRRGAGWVRQRLYP
jgi:pyridoxamine 5'-phosphate oxidase